MQKLTQPDKYNKVIENKMALEGVTREQAEKDYNAYLENPNDYALNKVRWFICIKLFYVLDITFSRRNPTFLFWSQSIGIKGEAYYKKLGYDSLMEGVVGEAEKRGEGDQVRERVDDFKRKSQLKAYAVIGTFISAFFYYKIQFDADPSSFMH